MQATRACKCKSYDNKRSFLCTVNIALTDITLFKTCSPKARTEVTVMHVHASAGFYVIHKACVYLCL